MSEERKAWADITERQGIERLRAFESAERKYLSASKAWDQLVEDGEVNSKSELKRLCTLSPLEMAERLAKAEALCARYRSTLKDIAANEFLENGAAWAWKKARQALADEEPK